MKKKNIFFMLILLLFVGTIGNEVLAANGLEWWDQSTNWYSSQTSNSVGLNTNMLDGIANLVEIVGTAVIAIATVVIGAKFMLGSVQGKVEAKENLITLLVACFFFFGWTNIRDLLITGNASGENGITGATQLIFFQGGNIQVAFSQIFTFIVLIAKLLCVLAIIYMGVKYIFAGANAKAQLKEKSPAMIIGIILIFCAVNVVGFIADLVTSI